MFSFVMISVSAVAVLGLAALGSHLHHQLRLRRHLNRLRTPVDHWNHV